MKALIKQKTVSLTLAVMILVCGVQTIGYAQLPSFSSSSPLWYNTPGKREPNHILAQATGGAEKGCPECCGLTQVRGQCK